MKTTIDHLIIDGNSYLNSALLKGTDHDAGYKVRTDDGKEVQVNGAEYGVENFFDKVVADIDHFGIAPRQIILVWDGKNAKMRRRALLARYKEGRDKIEEVNVELNKARVACTQMMLDLGATVMQQKGMEADDVIGYLTKSLPGRKVVATNDGDLSVLVDEVTDTQVWRLGEMNVQPYGPFPHKFITLYKALVGDSVDKIPGAAKFGDGKFVDLVRIFGMDGLELMQDLILTNKLARLREDVAEFPALQLIIDSADQVAISWRCAELHVEDVNTLNSPLEVQAGMVKTWASLSPERRVVMLRRFYATNTLVHASNYEEVKAKLAGRFAQSPFIALDIETSSSEESDEWTERMMKALEADREKIDTLGHELTGMSLTFGDNTQHTIYMTVDHKETLDHKNISESQCREVVEMIPESMFTVIHNRSFEFNVLYRHWGKVWAENGWGGFVPNAIDTVIGGSYVNENLPKGLKERSAHHLGYKQTTYEEVTTRKGRVGTMTGGVVKSVYPVEVSPAVTAPNPKSTEAKPLKDIIVEKAVTEDWEIRQYKMKELTADHVLGYGCDDTMCTAALHTYYQLVMALEGTWGVYLQVEQRPQYLTSLANIQGVKISMAKLAELERRDDQRYKEGWDTLRAFLLARGWEGTVRPEFEGSLEPSDVKLAAGIVLGGDYTTKKRKHNAMALDMREQFPDNDLASVLANFVEADDVEGVNKLVREHFTGEPQINFGSPKQMQNLFYNVMGMTPRVFNALTDKQREIPEMAAAFRKLRSIKDGKMTMSDLSPEERSLLISKASTDDDLIEFSLAKDTLTDEVRKALKAYQSVRSVMTRRSLFYKTYKAIPHWRTGRVHSNMNQCEAVTRRYSSSGPNLQQLPKLGDGAEFRGIIQPHKPTAIIVSCDFSGQELRLMAHYSKDMNLTACYVGDNLKDVHSLTAAAAAIYLWNKPLSYAEFFPMLESSDPQQKAAAKLLRADAKTVNFGTQYDMQAAALSIKMKVEESVAQQFIDAKDEAFPGIEIWKDSVRQEVEELGYATTLLGARRHLHEVLRSDNRWERAKAGRQGPNFKIQGSGAEQSKLSMGSMWDRRLFTGRYDAQFIAPIHDECVASVDAADPEHALAFIKEFHECMAQPYGGMTIPVVSSISIGPDFKNQIECGDFFDEAAIRDALAKIFKKEEVTA